MTSGKIAVAVIELFNPVYDITANTLTYTIMAENATSIVCQVSLDSLY
jgi:hypothetical protein